MNDWLHCLLRRVESSDAAVFSAAETDRWPTDALNWSLSQGLLVECEPASAIPCPSCAEQPIEHVVYLRQSTSDAVAIYLPCPHCGPVLVRRDLVRRWRASFPRLLELVLGPRLSTWSSLEIFHNLFWSLGRTTWADSVWQIFTLRSLLVQESDIAQRLHGLPPPSVVFVPIDRPIQQTLERRAATILPLSTVLSWSGSELLFDQAYVEQRLADATKQRTAQRNTVRPRKRASRAALIELLTTQLKEHLRAAQDHAQATAEFQGAAELLPRPTQRQLAVRFRVSEAAVSRCLHDPRATELRLLWRLAADIDALLSRSHA